MIYIRRNTVFSPPYPNMHAPYQSNIGMYPHNGYHQLPMQMQMGQIHAQQYMGPQYAGNNMPSQLFQNPLQIEEEHIHTQHHQANYTYPFQLPNQLPNQLPKPQTGHFNSFLNSFKSQSGNLDLNKMMDTAGQMMNALTQVSNMAKGIGGIFKA